MKTTIPILIGALLLFQSLFAGSTIQFQTRLFTVAETAGQVALPVVRLNDLETEVAVEFYSVGATATAGPDFTPVSGTLSFAAGVTNQTIHVPILNDALVEILERFQVALTNATGGAVLGSMKLATISIQDNDTGPHFASTTQRVAEDAGTVQIQVNWVITDTDEPQTVDYTTIDGTALAGTDYEAASGTLVFEAGERFKQIPVVILNDGVKDPDKSFQVQLSNASSEGLGDPALATVIIQDPTPVIYTQPTPASQSVSLGAAVKIEVSAKGAHMQWQKRVGAGEFTDIPGASSPVLEWSSATLDLTADYRFVVSDSTGETVISQIATLVVDPTFTKITQGPVVEDLQPTGGAAWGDYDGDKRLDLFVANGSETIRNSLYRNLGGDEFVRITNALTAALPRPTWGAQWADVDNDGDPDLFILHPFSAQGFPNNLARNQMFRNDGGGVFTPMANAITAVDGLWTEASWVDHDGDGWLDLFATTQSFAASQSLDDFFFHNLRDGTFAAWTTNEVGVVVAPQSKTAGPAWCDIDGDGDLDLYVSNFGGTTNFLYRNEGGRMKLSTAGSLPARRPTWAAVWADFNNDGLFDLFTGGENGTNTLHLNRGNWLFEDVTAASGLELAGNVYTAAVGDYDNDGDVDLYVPVYNATDVFYANRGDATFDRVNVGSPLTEGFQNGAMWVDYNNDGFLDLFEPCGDGTPALNLLYRNSLPEHGNSNHWLKLELKGTVSNASAIGARVWVRAVIGGKETWQLRQLTTSCYVTAPTDGLRAHFGLGDATSIDLLRIEWPSGNVQDLENVAPDQILTITESVGITPVRPTASLNGSATLVRSPVRRSTYQWRFNGVDLPGQTNQALTLSGITADQEGRYSVVVSNITTMVTNFVYLAVDATFTKITEGAPATDVEGSTTATWIDYDLDGDVDLFVGNGVDVFNSVYQNNGDGTFAKVSNALTTVRGNSWGVGWGDYDNDGLPDLFVAHPRNVRDDLFHNEGGGQFTRVTQGAIVTDTLDSVVPLWGDYDGDGFIDLFLATGYYSGLQPNRLYHNERDGSFRVTTANEAGDLVANPTLATTCGWSDYDNDGDPDLFVLTGSSISEPWTNFVFRNTPNAPFERVALPTLDAVGYSQGVAWGDYGNDGYLDLFLPSWAGTNGLMKNLQGADFENATQAAGLLTKMGSIAAAWADYDNDGWLDLFVGNYQGQPGYPGGNAVFRNNQDGTFTRMAMGSMSQEGGHCVAVACGDYDNDGFVDVYFACGDGLPEKNLFYRNNGNDNHWLKVRLDSPVSNRLGIGAKVRVLARIDGRTVWQMREITAQHSWIGDNGLIAHFGLGNATRIATLRIEWPSGTVQELTNVLANQMLTIVEPRRPVMNGALALDGSFQIEVTTENGRTYELQASDDLGSWTTTETYSGNGEVMRLTPIAPAEQHRFYRVHSP